jgi:hypothetical protein
VLDFLQQFHQHKNTLLANVNLSIPSPLLVEKMQPLLAQILPLIGDNINSLQILNHDLLGHIQPHNNVNYSENNEQFSGLMTKMLAQTRILSRPFRFLLSTYAVYQLNYYFTILINSDPLPTEVMAIKLKFGSEIWP